jgi:prophage tail gpP-like protein
MTNVSLIVNGVAYGGWTSVRVTRGLDAIAGGFSLACSERWASGPVGPAWPILEYDVCQVKVDDDVLIWGAVDRRTHKFNANDHTLGVEGRDLTGVLVDCCPVLTKNEFHNIGVLEFCMAICSPFNIGVTLGEGIEDKAISTSRAPTPGAAGGRPTAAGTAPKSSSTKIGRPNLAPWTIDPGESGFEAIDKACRLVGVLPVSDGAGGLLLTRSGTARATTALVQGKNILSADASYDGSQRYGRYIVLGQGRGDDENHGPAVTSVKGESVDEGVPESRVLVVLPEHAVDRAFAKMRADWEAKTRKARGRTVAVVVQGWRQGDGAVWPFNALVNVEIPTLGIDGQMLITRTTFTLSVEEGTTTELELAAPDAFTPEPVTRDTPSSPWPEKRPA